MRRVTATALDARANGHRAHRRPPHVALLGCGSAALALLLFPAVHPPQLRLVWNASASVPLGLYRIEPGVQPRIGDMVAVRPSPALTRFMADRRYVEANALLVKPVAALAGTTVCRNRLRVTIDDRVAATALAHDRFGRPLPTWSGCLRIAPNQLFLIAPRSPASFDSRYFGVVRSRQILGRAMPLCTWS